MKINNNMELRERIIKILNSDIEEVSPRHYKGISSEDYADKILSAIGNCGECKYSKNCSGMIYCTELKVWMKSTDFCSDFERREK